MLGALAVALASGIALADAAALAPEAAWIPAGAGLLLARGRGAPCGACALALAAGLHLQAQRLADAAAAEALEPREAVVEGVVAARASALAPRWIELERVRGAPVARLRLYAGRPGELERWLPGERLRARVRLAPLASARNPGDRALARARRRAGLGAKASLAHPSLAVAVGEGRGLDTRLHALRRDVARRLAAAGPGGALLRGLALGDRDDLAEATRAGFAKLGLAHALAVSGLHLVWATAASFGIARACLARWAWLGARADARRVALLPAALFALGYAALSGWGVPARRALVLLAAASLGALRGRPQRAGPALGAAALVVLAFEPQALFAPGAQLSFAAVGGLMLAAREAGDGPERRVARALRRSASAIAATAPVLAWHGGGVSGVALAANLVALPWLGGVLLPASLLAAASLALDAPGADAVARFAAQLAEVTVRTLEAAATGLPAVERAAPGSAWIAGVAALAAAALRTPRTPRRCALVALQAALLAAAPAATLDPPPPRLVALEVGQGDAGVVQGRRGVVVVDAGGAHGDWDAGRARVLPALRALGVARVDLLVATHADLDHRGGLPALVAALPVGEVWLPWGGLADADFAALHAAARRAGTPLREVGRGSPPRRFGELRVEPLWPPRYAAGSRNARSLVVRVAVDGGRRVLFPGDLDAAAEAALAAREAELGADVLLLPHHGSRGSGSAAFLARVAPRLAIASAPCRGRFGMPHAELRARLARLGVPLAWTGRDGAVRVALRGRWRVRGTGSPQRCPE